MRADNVIIGPMITEKTTDLATKKIYAFHVHEAANKDQIATQIQKMFNVTVDAVRTTVRKGEVKRVGRKMIPKQMANRKIAYVTVTKGTINIFPQM